jgi:hypothetical protein
VDGEVVAESNDIADRNAHPRAAWSTEAPRPEMKAVGSRFGFRQDVKVA